MSDAFDKTLELAAESFFLLPGTETITYFPAAGSSRQIRAVVSRPGPEQMADLSGGQRASLQILVKNSSSEAIASAEINTGGDKVQIAARANRQPILMRIVEILGQNAGTIKLKVT